MIARLHPASRLALVAVALFAIGVAVNARLLAKSLHPPAQVDPLWNPLTIDIRLAPILAELPPRCTVGWSSPPDALRPHDAEPLYLLQYALAPRIVIADAHAEWLMTESPDHQLHLKHRNLK